MILGLPSAEECDINLQTLKLVCKDLGVPLATGMHIDPSIYIFLGIISDIVKQEYQLSRD